MEAIELDDGLSCFSGEELPVEGDFGSAILARLGRSQVEEDQHICAVLGAMSQELKDQGMPSTPIAYFGTTWSSLERLLSEPEPAASRAVEALISILSLLFPRVSVAVLRKKAVPASALVVRALQVPTLAVSSVVAGLKCVLYLLTIRDDANWSEVSQLYGILLGFVTDSRPKVRRQSQLCVRDVLQKYQRTSLLAPACEGLTNAFERFLLLAGGSNSNPNEGPKGAQEVLHVLDTLKECLPLMSVKYTSVALKYFKTLLELHQPLVTRRVTDGLLLLCIKPDARVSAEMLLDILCALAHSVSTSETSVDAMAFTARLLDVGMAKVYSINRELCIVKLPVVFSALRDVLASEHEEAVHSAVQALKHLIHNCVDETLIKQGVNGIKTANLSMESRRSGPTIVEKLCALIESLLGYNYTAVLDLSFQVVSSMFDKLGSDSSYLMRDTIKSLADMEKLPDEDFPFRKQLHECLGSCLAAMGPQVFLSILPFNLEADDLADVNAWIFPIVKQYTIGAHLSFFVEILDMIRQMKKKSKKLELHGRVHASRSVDGIVYSLWSLLTSFCNYPLDTAESLKDLEKDLSRVLQEEELYRGIICSSLQILVQQNKKVLENKDLDSSDVGAARQQVLAYYTPKVAEENLSALKKSALVFLPVLASVFLNSGKDDGGSLQSAIGELASISDKKAVSKLFMKTMSRLLSVTQKAGEAGDSKKHNKSMAVDQPLDEPALSAERGQLLDLAVALLPGLSIGEIKVLFSAIKPALQDCEGSIQKKAYKVLSLILKNYGVFFSSDPEELQKQLEDLLPLMIEALPSCHFSAKRHRLDCLYFLIIYVSKINIDLRRHEVISSFLTEIILALKETNKKTRNRAYEIIVEIGHAYGDEEKGGKRENLFEFFNMVAGGLAGDTPHMISAAVKGLARLVYEFSDLLSSACSLLPSTYLLLRRKNKEIIKANLGLLKVLVAKSKAEGLQLHLKSMVEGLLMWQDDTKTLFKAKVRLVLEMLVKKCGLETVKAVMPEEHMKLLANIQKINTRKEKKLDAPSEDNKSRISKATSRQSRWNHSKIFSDFGDEETENSDGDYLNSRATSGKQGKDASHLKSKASSMRSKIRASKNLPEHLFDQIDEDEPLDLLDAQRTRSALKSVGLKRKQSSDNEPEFDPEGRMIIREGENPKNEKEYDSDDDSDTVSKAGSRLSKKSKSASTQKRQKTADSGWAYTGKEYTNKKAGGDLKKKDKLEPYAYWPLDRKMMSRRPEHRAKAKKGMVSVVKMTKHIEGKSASGFLAAGGLKMKKRGHNKKIIKRKSK